MSSRDTAMNMVMVTAMMDMENIREDIMMMNANHFLGEYLEEKRGTNQ